LGLPENVFVYEGRPMHAIVLAYEAEFLDRAWYGRNPVTGGEDDGRTFTTLRKPLPESAAGRAILFPDGMLELTQTASPAEKR
jgi:hypothetical protein